MSTPGPTMRDRGRGGSRGRGRDASYFSQSALSSPTPPQAVSNPLITPSNIDPSPASAHPLLLERISRIQEKEDRPYIATCTKLRQILKQGPYDDIEAGNYSDIKVKCFEKTFNLHRAVVCPQSQFFAAALRPGSFMESETKEVLLPEDDPRIFSMFVQLMYLGELDSDSTSKPEQLMDYVKLYVMADKYGSPPINKLALQLVQPKISSVLLKATQNSASNIWDIFTDVVEYVYSNIPSPVNKLRCAIVRDTAPKWKHISISEEQVKKFLRTVPDFAVDLLSRPTLFGDAKTE